MADATAGEQPPFRPIIQEFPAEKYKQFAHGATLKGFSLSDVLLMPSRHWFVFVVESNNEDQDIAEPVAVGSYHVGSGRKRQLVFPLLSEARKSRMLVELVPLEGDCCGVVIGLLCPEDDSRGAQTGKQHGRLTPRWKRFLWEWDLRTDSVRYVGPWNGALTYTSRFVKVKQCRLCWEALPNGDMTGVLTLADLSSGNVGNVSLNLGIGNLNTDGVTCARTSAPCAIAVCDASGIDKGRLQVICVDPNSPKGLRWAITKAALEKTVGPGIAGAALLQHVESSGRPLPLFVHRVLNNQCFSHLLFLDQQSGEVAKRQTIPINVAYPKLPIISPDYRRIVADVSDISEWGKRDNFAMNLPLRLRVVDLVLQHHFFGTTFGCLASQVFRCESVARLLRARW